MSSQDKMITYLRESVDVTDEEAMLFCSYFKEVKVKKGQYIIQPNFIARQRNFVLDGSFRSFVTDDKGNDHTINFAIENWWITDLNSYINQQPATMFVVAMENSLLFQIDYESEQELKRINHKYETFWRIRGEKGMAFLQKRLISNLTHSAEERYDNFLKLYPSIAERVPQYALASFLHMTTQFLSRIRKNKTKSETGLT